MEISEKIIKAYTLGDFWGTDRTAKTLRDALRAMTARAMEYEHADHCETCFHWHGSEKKVCEKVNLTQAGWEAVAEKALQGNPLKEPK